jgi:tetratricopeptide (TPR) repeat protein
MVEDVNLLSGNFDAALTASESALSIAQGLGDKKLRADANAAVTRAQFGGQNRGKAWRSALQTAEMYRELGDKVGEAMTLNIIAQIHMENFRLHEALRTAEQGLSLAREGGSVKCTDTLLDIVVNAHAERGDVMEAQALARDQLAAVEGKPGEAAAWMRVVKTYRATGDVPGALKLAKDSLKRLMAIGSEVLEAEMNLILARLYFEDQNSEAALVSAQQAVKLYKKLDSQKGEDSARQLISDVRVARGEKPPPSRERTESLAFLKELVQAFEGRDTQAWQLAAAKLSKARCVTQGDIDDALSGAFMAEPLAARSFLEDVAESTGAPPDFVQDSLMIELKDKIEPVVEKGPQGKGVEMGKQLCYAMTRYGGMGFGPRFRVDQLLFGQRDSNQNVGLACVPRLQMSGCETWEEKVYFHPGLVDCPIHSTNAFGVV